jgi:hypothetical protein
VAEGESPDLSPLDDEAAAIRAAGGGNAPLAEDEQRAFTARADHAQKMRKIDLGWFGRIFGSGDEKKGNIAGGAILVSFGMVAALLIFAEDAPLREKVVTSLINIVTLSLGYLFGHGTGGGQE